MKSKVKIAIVLISLIGIITTITVVYRQFKRKRNMDKLQNSNLQAFLKLIRYAEGTERESNPYAVCYGYSHVIKDFSEHPAITGEWTGKRLPDSMCRNAGFNPGCKSTAAGAYQIIKPTWIGLRNSLGLKDFSPESQDLAAIELLRQRNALSYIEKGDIETAIFNARKEWASFPGAGYGQGEKSLQAMLGKFNEFKNYA